MSVAASLQAAPRDAAVDDVLAGKGSATVAVCVPARDEAATVGFVVETVRGLVGAGVVDEIIVVDDGSVDGTAAVAAAAGAAVVANRGGRGKGQAMTAGARAAGADIVVFLDADVTNVRPEFVTALVRPLLEDGGLQLVKATYQRPLHGRAHEGGRVNELLARPLLRRFFPELAHLAQPLAGECAVRRTVLDDVVLADGYGVEIGLLVDVCLRYGPAAITEVDLGVRVHRNRPLDELRQHTDDILDALLARVRVP